MQFAGLVLLLVLLQGGGKSEFKDVKVGDGIAAADFDIVSMEYTGKFTDGKVFDSSKKHGGKPFVFILGVHQVIKGWDQGVLGMKVGGKRKLTLPPDLAYGPGGTPDGTIPPNSTLVFDVELKGVHKCDYKVLKAGSGEGAKMGDTLDIQYTGTFKDGKKFDSSFDRGTPMTIRLGRDRLVPGFVQALLGLKQGEKRKVDIPSDYAYGDGGVPNRAAGAAPGSYIIPPKATLVFELELVRLYK
jgi:FKBP-type peptidyl-prolyl cis-trans isomerase